MYVRALSPTTTLRRKKEEPEDPYAKAKAGPNYHAMVRACVLGRVCVCVDTLTHPITQPPPPQIPLLYAPLLPLIRIGLRGRLPQRQIDVIFGGAVLTALAHAGYIMGSDSSV